MPRIILDITWQEWREAKREKYLEDKWEWDDPLQLSWAAYHKFFGDRKNHSIWIGSTKNLFEMGGFGTVPLILWRDDRNVFWGNQWG